jgi:hypothetical protein
MADVNTSPDGTQDAGEPADAATGQGTLSDADVDRILNPDGIQEEDIHAEAREILGIEDVEEDAPPVKANKADAPAEESAEPETNGSDDVEYLKRRLGEEANKRAEAERQLQEKAGESGEADEPPRPMDANEFMSAVTAEVLGSDYWDAAKEDEGNKVLGLILHSMGRQFSQAMAQQRAAMQEYVAEMFQPLQEESSLAEHGLNKTDVKALTKGHEDWLPKKGTKEWYQALTALKGVRSEGAPTSAPKPNPSSFVEPTDGGIPIVRAPQKSLAQGIHEAVKHGDLDKSGKLVDSLLAGNFR